MLRRFRIRAHSIFVVFLVEKRHMMQPIFKPATKIYERTSKGLMPHFFNTCEHVYEIVENSSVLKFIVCLKIVWLPISFLQSCYLLSCVRHVIVPLSSHASLNLELPYFFFLKKKCCSQKYIRRMFCAAPERVFAIISVA